MSLLTLIQDATDLLGIARPSTVVASQDAQVRQLLSLAKEEGAELYRRNEAGWKALQAEWTFTTTGTPEQTDTPVPLDWASFVPETFFNRTTNRRLLGPISPQKWQQLQAFPAAGSIFLMFRQRGGDFLITPTPPDGQLIAYEYRSKAWAASQTGQLQTTFLADADTTFLEERLLTLGVRWRFLKTKGFPYAEDKDTYDRAVDLAIAQDIGSRDLNLASSGPSDRGFNIPEGSWPSS